jgi:tartrate-resistant acid phosphatase type 5
MNFTLNFVAFGDWGMTGLNQTLVAAQMALYNTRKQVEFIIALGDNFYMNGVSSDIDEQWVSTYRDVYTQPSLQVPWYAILGNHDYHKNPQAQIDYYHNKRDGRWVMPDHSYSILRELNDINGTTVEIIFIDTPMLCPTETIETSRGGIHEVTIDMTNREYTKIERMLNESTATWLLVAGHYTSEILSGVFMHHGSRKFIYKDNESYVVCSLLDGRAW